MKAKILFTLVSCICLVVVFSTAKLVHNDKVSASNSNAAETESMQTGDKDYTVVQGESDKTEDDTESDKIEDYKESDKTDDYSGEFSVYNNPIDEYFLPRIYSWDVCEAEIRAYQDSYKYAWKAEFENLLNWLREKCIYDEDKKNIKLLEKSVSEHIEKSREVIVTELLDVYNVNPDPGKVEDGYTRNVAGGNGTRSRLNQIEGRYIGIQA